MIEPTLFESTLYFTATDMVDEEIPSKSHARAI
jgi:hypothetical protein